MKEHLGRFLNSHLIDPSEPITAWRSWRLSSRRRWYRPDCWLYSTWKWEEWPIVGMVARCHPEGRRKCNLVMKEDCSCGVWATKTLIHLAEHGSFGMYPVCVFGQVTLYGLVHEYERGFRAGFGKPKNIWLGTSFGQKHADILAAHYSIPVYLGFPDGVFETVVYTKETANEQTIY